MDRRSLPPVRADVLPRVRRAFAVANSAFPRGASAVFAASDRKLGGTDAKVSSAPGLPVRVYQQAHGLSEKAPMTRQAGRPRAATVAEIERGRCRVAADTICVRNSCSEFRDLPRAGQTSHTNDGALRCASACIGRGSLEDDYPLTGPGAQNGTYAPHRRTPCREAWISSSPPLPPG